MSGLYNHNFSPARAVSPQIRNGPDMDSQYLTELLAEHRKLVPFMQVLPICSRLLNQVSHKAGGQHKRFNMEKAEFKIKTHKREYMIAFLFLMFGVFHDVAEIMRLSGTASNQGFGDYDRLRHRSPSPMASANLGSNPAGMGFGGWNGLPQEQFNFVGRLLGPRGNSLKRVEASTGCRVYIRGKGSIKDPAKAKSILGKTPDSQFKRGNIAMKIPMEEKLRGKPGYEHLSEPLHILVEAELPANIVDARLRHAKEILEELLKPVEFLGALFLDAYFLERKECPTPKCLFHTPNGWQFVSEKDESQDFYKREQLRELALLNSNFREESPRPSGSVSPFNTSGMKRAKTGR
ncbi:hypothetical protein ACLOJK_031541 [Asimina triloba]